MKHFVIWAGIGNNEQAWARLLSQNGARTYLYQRGLCKREEVWEGGIRTCASREEPVAQTRFWDDLFFGQFSSLKTALRIRRVLGNDVADLLIAESNRGLMSLALRRLGIIRRFTFLLSDHFTPTPSRSVSLHRRIVGNLHRFIARHADEVWAVSPRIPASKVNPNNHVVPIYIDKQACHNNAIRTEIVYIGNPSPDHGLELLFEIACKHKWVLNIIGDSPYLQKISDTAPPGIKLHGFIADRDRIAHIMASCFCGYAVYINTSQSGYSYYGIPSKAFYYLGNNLPFVSTNTSYFSPLIQQNKIGKLVNPTFLAIEQALLELKDNYTFYQNNIEDFRIRQNADVLRFLQERTKSCNNIAT